MKKIFSVFIAILILVTSCCVVYGASVTPIEYPGNDANPNQFTPPTGSVRITLPNSDVPGTHIYKFNQNGSLDSTGSDTFTLVVGTVEGTSYTQVLSWSWSGSSSLYAVIVKGGPAFNLYEYNGEITNDTNLVSPVNSSGHPADISHVSIILFPSTSPPVPPIPPECPTTVVICCIIIAIMIFILVIINLLILCILKCCCRFKKHHHHEC